MKRIFLGALALAALLSSVLAQTTTNAFDFGANYGSGWTDGANGGFGFGAWSLIPVNGTGSAGNFIGDPNSQAGIGGMSAQSFGLYANPAGSGAYMAAVRQLTTPLQVGETFSLQWGINFDGNNGIQGNKGFNLKVGGVQVVNVNNGGNSDIQVNGLNTLLGYGTNAMTWSFTYSNSTTLAVVGTARDGGASFTTNVTVTGGIDTFELYADQLSSDNPGFREPFFNDFAVTVPEPSTYALLALSGIAFGGYVIRRRRR